MEFAVIGRDGIASSDLPVLYIGRLIYLLSLDMVGDTGSDDVVQYENTTIGYTVMV